MPLLIVTTSSKQLHDSGYTKSGYYDEPCLLHVGAAGDPAVNALLAKLKARAISPLPREFNLHWETSCELMIVLQAVEAANYSLFAKSETADRVSFTFKSNPPPAPPVVEATSSPSSPSSSKAESESSFSEKNGHANGEVNVANGLRPTRKRGRQALLR